MARKLTRSEAAAIIEKFVADETDEYEWDDFTSVRYSDPLVESARRRCLAVHDEYPAPPGIRRYCSEEGVIVLRSIAVALRADAQPCESSGAGRIAWKPVGFIQHKRIRIATIAIAWACFAAAAVFWKWWLVPIGLVPYLIWNQVPRQDPD